MIPRRQHLESPADSLIRPSLLERVGVRPPYFALTDIDIAGRVVRATTAAESPAFLEIGPMPAAELGRHAAIVGLAAVAAQQPDNRRRYYLARRAECRYVPNEAPYGAPVRFHGRVIEHDKRTARAAIDATANGEPLASFVVDYTVLTDSAFERLFRTRAKPTPSAPSPYGSLLTTSWQGTTEMAEQVVESLPVSACVGHFDGYPALPVAVLMGQLSYLAGRLHEVPYRVVRGDVEASDLVWAGERAVFRVARHGEGDTQDTLGSRRYRCEAWAGDRSVAAMTLWLESVDESLGDEALLTQG